MILVQVEFFSLETNSNRDSSTDVPEQPCAIANWHNNKVMCFNVFIPCKPLGYAVGESRQTKGWPNKLIKF